MEIESNEKQNIESVWIIGDQLLESHPALDPSRKNQQRVVMIESMTRLTKHSYHKQKVVLILAAMRHYARSLRDKGWEVDYRIAPSFKAGLTEHLMKYDSQKLVTMAAAEYEARMTQVAIAEQLKIAVEILPNTQFLVGQFAPAEKAGRKLIMELFYREMRKHFAVLMEPDGLPSGGSWNYDDQNRQAYKGKPKPPPLPSFFPDEVTTQVQEFVEENCPQNIGTTDGFNLPVTRSEALAALEDFVINRLPYFGPYEDAMSTQEPVLFHSLLSPLLNIGLLEPLEVVRRVERAYREGNAPLNSVEGFVRQVIGWREYMYWRYHKKMPGFHSLNAWEAHKNLPAFWWDARTEMNCIKLSISQVLKTGYNHHIERLMVLCNFALLAGIDPKQVNDWFLTVYWDAYDWVVTPNVIGMGLCADGGIVGTKPYIASGSYINRMSDFCKGCKYSPKERIGPKACPYNFLYWNFLLKHEEKLRANPRMGPNVLGLRHIEASERKVIAEQAQKFLAELPEGSY